MRTGDLATVDPEGYMQIVDRAKALIRSGGESISSVALETALLRHPQVLEAAVIGVPDEKWGERPVAFIVLTPVGAECTRDLRYGFGLFPDQIPNRTDDDIADTLRHHLISEFPKFWIPDRFVCVDEIPKTSVGKSDKQTLRKRLLSAETEEKLS